MGKFIFFEGVKCLRVLSCSSIFRPKERPEELFGRDSELKEVLRLVRMGSWVVVLGHRMVGKSSLLKVSLAVLEKQGYRALYLSL